MSHYTPGHSDVLRILHIEGGGDIQINYKELI